MGLLRDDAAFMSSFLGEISDVSSRIPLTSDMVIKLAQRFLPYDTMIDLARNANPFNYADEVLSKARSTFVPMIFGATESKEPPQKKKRTINTRSAPVFYANRPTER